MIDDKLIIRYLDGEMPEDEKLRFEEEISSNSRLAKRVDQVRKIQELAVKAAGRADDPEERLDPETRKGIRQAVIDFREGGKDLVPDEVRETIKAAGKAFEKRKQKDQHKTASSESEPDRPNIKQIRRIWFRAAVIVAFAVILSILIFRPFRGKPARDLYTAYYKEFPLTGQMSELSRTDDDLLFAIKVYEAGDYERAIVLFEMLADSAGLREYSLFYAGHAYMHLNLTDKAIETFQTLLKEAAGELTPATRWYLALCYLKTGQAESSKELLVQLKESDSPYRKDARMLLRDLQ